MNPHVSAITLGVGDLSRAKAFYADGLGWPILQDYDQWVSFQLGNGSTILGLIPRDALASDTGAPAGGSGPPSITLSYVVRADDRVEAVLAEAERAGATITKPAKRPPWGGCSGYFADPDGYLWKVSSGSGDQPYAE